MAISAVADYYLLVQDYTLDPGGTSGSFVSQSFSLAGTLPIRINGGASADFSTSPNTVSVNTFGAAAAGIVPLSGGGTSNFLRADGTWAVPGGAGGYTTIAEEGVNLTQRGLLNFIGSDLTAVDNSGSTRTDVTLTRFSSIVGGTVPPSGGSSAAFLCADGTWKTTVGAAGEVSLQASTPGVADSGSAHITTTFLADTNIGVSTNAPYSASKIHTVDTTGTRPYSFVGQGNGVSGRSEVWLRRSRGTETVPTATLDNDQLGAFLASGYNTNNAYTGIKTGMTVYADGNASATIQPTYVDINGGGSQSSIIRVSQVGTLIEPETHGTSHRATSTAHINGSFARKVTTFSGGTPTYTVAVTDCIHLVDTTAASKVFTLPLASTCAGRQYTFVKTDATTGTVAIIRQGSDLINGVTQLALYVYGESASLVSDGTNWWSYGDTRMQERTSTAADSTPYASSVVETLAAFVGVDTQAYAGGAYWQYYAGKFSTTGTPTLRFRLQSPHADTIADSTALTMPNNAANYPWMVRTRSYIRTVAASVGTGRMVEAILSIGSSTGVLTQYSMLSNTGDITWGGTGQVGLYLTWGTSSASNTITCTACEGGGCERTDSI